MRAWFIAFGSIAFLQILQGCTCCAYYNHMFNAERAYSEGEALRLARLDSLPQDSSLPTGEERKKYDRAIEKSSRTIERFPTNTEQKPRAVFLIAESFRHKGEYSKAVVKYDEFERYFSDHDSMPAVEYQRAWCLYRNREFSISRFALERVLLKGETHPYYHAGLNLLSLLDEQANFPDQAIAALEEMLASGTGTPFLRGQAHLRLAELYFKQSSWDKALEHYLAKEIQLLGVRERYLAAVQAVECLANLSQFAKAAEECKTMAMVPDFEKFVADIEVRRGELMLRTESWDEGLNMLARTAAKYPKTEPAARAWYSMGDFEQVNKKDYVRALVNYDSSYATFPSSTWGRSANERRMALRQLAKLGRGPQSDGRLPSPKEEFQMAELFLFKLSEVDSALQVLNGLSQQSTDSTIRLRAAYAEAFIYDEYKNDSLKADSLYRNIIEKFPGTEFAKQAQRNMGQPITVQTDEDLAHVAFLKAESSWVAVTALSVDSIQAMDVAIANAVAQYDSVSLQYPKTKYGIQAMYAKAFLYETEIGQIDSAKIIYDELSRRYSDTPWGIRAREKLQGKLKITDQEIERLRERVKQNDKNTANLRERFDEEMKQQQIRQQRQDKDPAEDEYLDNDYNSLYDFK